MIIDVVRHGETEYNAQRRYAGSTDVPLNARGLEQADALRRQLADTAYDAVVCSTMLRARQTAEVVCAGRGLSIEYMDAFRERNVGVYEGLTGDEARARYPEMWAANPLRTVDGAPPGGESTRQVCARVDAALDVLRARMPDKHVLLVCHGFVSRAVNRYAKALSFEDMGGFSLDNCEVVRYTL